MAKKVKGATITFEVTDNGTLKMVSGNAEKAATSVKKVGQTAHSADRSLKGAANASSGASKNFSKLSQGITGGLVPAYATLAANLFAVDALFRFLKTSADFRVLTQGQTAFAAATGVAYKSLAHDLQAATRNMINFRDAAQAGAIGRAAGLSAGQLNELAEASFKVSMALGRDVTDSFNRLVRGVTKAEPELLDELGIVLRLEEATTKYAASLGLNKNQLSIYQKSQAVVNEVLDQAERKFGKINAIMEPNANSIAQLGVAFEKTIDSIRPFISALAEPVGKFFTENITAAAIAMGLFATTIINSVIPSYGELQQKQLSQTAAHEEQLDKLRLKTEALQKARNKLAKTPIYQEKFMKRMGKDGLDVSKLGGESGAALQRGEALTNRQIGAIKAQVTKGTGAFAGMTEQMKLKYKAMLDDMVGKNNVATQKIKLSWSSAINTVQLKTASLQSFWTKAMGKMAAATRTVTMAMTGLLSFMSYIGIAILLFQAGKAAFDKFFGPDKAQIDEFNNKINEATESTSRLNKELRKMGLVAEQGLLDTPIEKMEHLGEAVMSANLDKIFKDFAVLEMSKDLDPEKFSKFQTEVQGTLDALAVLNPEFKIFSKTMRLNGRLTEQQIIDLKKMSDGFADVGAAAKELREIQGELVKEQNRLVQSLPKVPYQNMLQLLEKQINAYKRLGPTQAAAQELASANLEYYTKIQQRAIALEIEMLLVKEKGLRAGLAGAPNTKEEIKLAEEILKLRKAEYAIDELRLKITTSKLDEDSLVLKGMKDQLKLAEQTLEVQKQQVTMAGLMANNFFTTYNDALTGIYTDFGKGMGKAIRGEDGAFDDLGKNLKNTVSNAIGDALAKQFLDDVIPEEMKPESMADQINKAGTYHAELVKNRIIQGGQHHANSLVGVANAMTRALAEVQNRQNVARRNVIGQEMTDLATAHAKGRDRKAYLQQISDEPGITNYLKTDAGKSAEKDFIMRSLTDNDLGKYREQQADISVREDAIADLIKKATEAGGGNLQKGLKERMFGFGSVTFENKIKQYEGLIERSGETMDDIMAKYDGKFEKSLKGSILQTREEIMLIDQNLDAIGMQLKSKGVEHQELGRVVAQGGIDQIKKVSVDGNIEDENDDSTKEKATGIFGDQFSENLNKFSGTIGLLGAVAGKDEEVAKIMTIVAKLQMANALMERVMLARKAAMEAKEGASKFAAAFASFFGARQGGIMNPTGYRSYSDGGVASGPTAGYPAVLHGREAVVPLPNGRSIPVEMGKGAGGTNNVSINVNMAEGTTDVVSDREEAKALGVAINQAVYQVLEKEQRQGGLLGG